MVDRFLASRSGKSDCQILPLCFCQSPPPRRLHQKPSLRFRSPSSVVALSIISYSQQTLLLIKDVNLWVACSRPPLCHSSPSAGVQRLTSGAAFQNMALSWHVVYTEGDLIHFLKAASQRTWCQASSVRVHTQTCNGLLICQKCPKKKKKERRGHRRYVLQLRIPLKVRNVNGMSLRW